MDRARTPPPNTFAGLSLVLDRVAERRDDYAWIDVQARSVDARYLLLDAVGDTLLQRDRQTLRWLDAAEREQRLGDVPASRLAAPAGRRRRVRRSR